MKPTKTLFEKVSSGRYVITNPLAKRDLMPYFLQRAICVDADNVSIWAEESRTTTNKLLKICPMRLPFPAMWLEWEIIITHESGDARGKAGALIFEYEDEKEQFCAVGFYDDPVGEIFACTYCVNVSAQDVEVNNLPLPPQFKHPKQAQESYITNGLIVVLSALVFFSCKNVELRRVAASKKQQRAFQHKHEGEKPRDFHVIEVHKNQVRNVYEGISNAEPTIMPAQIVRGHFKNYTAQAPLFGKIVGNFFWQSHVRGDGPVTLPEYRVWPPSDRHKKKCLVQ